ncbi:hypothetical protein [Alkalilimnicola sp. S0819]|uniref:hypothetical protein n=1 Tax=Alkalilimnicola sp. S0819 TaxID=2613922 RepID=UPI001262109C|nr:hypothetical protein [Alkalilimnicola sp. S0819]KAB7624344.1 hypothetical protein F3N43_05925 [Alkalilimnicola sp. S0819]MPQ16170.1 hypothetical protein [Alkalilimnicola sp. S0819]
MKTVTVEVVPHAEAPWAPQLKDARWAWRVTAPSGTDVACATRGTEAQARRAAQRMAARLGLIVRGQHVNAFKINPSKAVRDAGIKS